MNCRWIVECNNCGEEITVEIVDESPNVQPPKPVMRSYSEAMKCPFCKVIADYRRCDLRFRSA
jgi:hypothetical protein